MYKGRKELYKDIITKIINTCNYEQIPLIDAMGWFIDKYKLTSQEVNELWTIIYYCVKDVFNQNCYHFELDNNKLNKLIESSLSCNSCKYAIYRGTAKNKCNNGCALLNDI